MSVAALVTNYKSAAGTGCAKQSTIKHLTNSLLHIFHGMVYGKGKASVSVAALVTKHSSTAGAGKALKQK